MPSAPAQPPARAARERGALHVSSSSDSRIVLGSRVVRVGRGVGRRGYAHRLDDDRRGGGDGQGRLGVLLVPATMAGTLTAIAPITSVALAVLAAAPIGRERRAGLTLHEARKLRQRQLIHLALELNDGLERHPVLAPPPRIELRMLGGAQLDVAVATDHAQQEPDLFLAPIVAAYFAADELVRHLIPQPVARATDDPDVFWQQADFFVQFAEHRLFGRFAVLDAALWKLPGVLANALAPEHLVSCVDEDDAD
ncbi:hypothetical protein COLO4_00854, partial [Corchorus olitorius]